MSTSRERLISMERWFCEDEPSPAGRLIYGGFATHRGIPETEMRVLGTYGLIYVLEGTGTYTDAAHRTHAVAPGDLIQLFPEMPHAYGPPAGGHWREFFVHFQGPVFDTWRQSGLLTPTAPIRRVEPIAEWLPRLEQLVSGPRLPDVAAATGRVCDFLKQVTLMTASGTQLTAAETTWLQRACDMLADDLNEPLDPERVAHILGMSYSSLRHQFRQEVGMSLTAYRTLKRLQAAGELLRGTDLSQRSIARRVGFADEFQFSRRFKQVMGTTPSQWRKDKNGAHSGQPRPKDVRL